MQLVLIAQSGDFSDSMSHNVNVYKIIIIEQLPGKLVFTQIKLFQIHHSND